MSIRLAVFDWNGTLFDDTDLILQGVNEGELRVLGHPPITLEEYRENQEMPIYRFYENLGVSKEEFTAKSKAIAEAFHPIYEPLAARANTRPGARELLKTLKDRGLSVAILSNHTVEGIYLQLSRLNLEDYFDAVLANDNIFRSSHTSKQQRIEDYLADNNIQPHEAVIIGDTVEETRIGKNVGMHTIAITGGCGSEHRLATAEPDAVIHTLSQINQIVEELA